MSSYFRSLKKGFTLLELVLVLAIIALLATVGFFSASASLQKARNSKRVTDLENMKLALEHYRNDDPNQSYPPPGTNLKTALAPYISNYPEDPINNTEYAYVYSPSSSTNPSTDSTGVSCDGTAGTPCSFFELNAKLENSDKTITQTYQVTPYGSKTITASAKDTISATPSPVCQQRPACLDSSPRCAMMEPAAGWCQSDTAPTLTPTSTSTVKCSDCGMSDTTSVDCKQFSCAAGGSCVAAQTTCETKEGTNPNCYAATCSGGPQLQEEFLVQPSP